MPATASLVGFFFVSLGLVLTPGPNMIYLVSRSICQGRTAGLISLGGVACGYVFYVLCAAFGVTAILLAIPYAYDVLRGAGCIYLAVLAWQAVRPGARAPFEVRALPADRPLRLFLMGLMTNLLNPKIAFMYVSLLPQFIAPERGHVLMQSLVLGLQQTCVSLGINALVVVSAGAIATFLATRPAWATAQRWLMATVHGGLAVRMATDTGR